MRNGIQLGLVVLLLSGAHRNAHAERRHAGQAGPDGAAAAAQLGGQWFRETDAQRQALEDVAIDPREERRIGEAERDGFLKSLEQQHVRVLERGKDWEYLNALVERLRPLMQHANRYQTIRLYVADSKETDARAFPGGSIVVMRGLVDFAESEAALVGVLGHELSHIDHGHQLRMARAAKLAQGGWEFRQNDPQAMQERIMMMSRNFAKPFSAEDEATADRDGATWALALGYDPMELARLFRRMDRRQPAGPMRMPEFLRTHPYHAERYAAVRDLSNQFRTDHPQQQLYVGRQNLNLRVPRSSHAYPE